MINEAIRVHKPFSLSVQLIIFWGFCLLLRITLDELWILRFFSFPKNSRGFPQIFGSCFIVCQSLTSSQYHHTRWKAPVIWWKCMWGSTDRACSRKTDCFCKGKTETCIICIILFNEGLFSGHTITGICRCLEFMRTSLHVLHFLRTPGTVLC